MTKHAGLLKGTQPLNIFANEEKITPTSPTPPPPTPKKRRGGGKNAVCSDHASEHWQSSLFQMFLTFWLKDSLGVVAVVVADK